MDIKKCSKCGEVKPINEFYKIRKGGDRRSSQCKTCHKNYMRDYSRDNQKVKERVRRYCSSSAGKYTLLKSGAKQKNIKFDINRDEFIKWFDSQKKICFYCKRPLSMNGVHSIKSLSIDRCDNSVGYKLDNIVLSCVWCNTIKSWELTKNDMIIIGEVFHRRRLENEKAGNY